MSGTQAKFAHSVKLQPPPNSQPEVQTWSTDYAFRCSLSNHSGPRDANWLVDSGASQHMSDQRWAFVNYQTVKLGCWPVSGIGEDRKPLQVHGYGRIPISFYVGGSWHNGMLQELLHVPKLGANLFSVRSATKHGFRVDFLGDDVKISKNEKVVADGSSTNSNLYRLNVLSGHGERKLLRPQESFAALARPSLNPIQLWHQRLGHVCVSTIKKMAAEKMADGLLISEENKTTSVKDVFLGSNTVFLSQPGGPGRNKLDNLFIRTCVVQSLFMLLVGLSILSLLRTILVAIASSISLNKNPK